MKKSYKILFGVLILLAIYNPKRKDFASQNRLKDYEFTSRNFIVFSVYITKESWEYTNYGRPNLKRKKYTLGLLGNLIDL